MRHVGYAILAIALWGCNDDSQVTEPTAQQDRDGIQATYSIEKLASLGGSLSRGTAVSRRGVAAGWSDQADGSRRAVLWRDDDVKNLLTLGGPASSVPWPGLNDRGMVVGISLTSEVDPLDEEWSCEFAGFLPISTNLVCRGFVWDREVMRELPTLGGNHSFATMINNRGQAVGWAETAVHDPTCSLADGQILQFRGVVWRVKPHSIEARELRPFGDDSASAAVAINDRGVVVGISGDCDQAVGRFSARHAVMWDRKGRVRELPNLGGITWHTPMDINRAGDVVGFSNPPGENPVGSFIAQAFYVRHGSTTATPLGILEGNAFSQAFAINNRGQIVGVSFGGSAGTRAFLYEDGELKDLNDVIPVAPDVLLSAQDINDAGQITGRILDASTGEQLTFIATPGRR